MTEDLLLLLESRLCPPPRSTPTRDWCTVCVCVYYRKYASKDTVQEARTLGCSSSCPLWSGWESTWPGGTFDGPGALGFASRRGPLLGGIRHGAASEVRPSGRRRPPSPGGFVWRAAPTARRPRAQPTKQATVPGPYANAPGGQRPAAGFQPERVGRAGGGRAPGIEHHCLCHPRREDLHRLRELQLWGQTE